MTNTTYYNLNIVEGTDIVNPLTVDNPNYEKIDETMHNNAVSGVTLATEIANATVHAITRENSECAVIRFIATSEWKAGDSATVDGVPVTALLPSGETLPDGAYVINSNVLCILTGTNMTVFAERKKTDNATDIKYNDTNVGLELDKINNDVKNINHLSAEYTGRSSFSEIPNKVGFYFYLVSYTGVDPDAPDKSNDAWWWNVITFGEANRLSEIALCPYRYLNSIFIRHKHDNEWTNWYKIEGSIMSNK